MSMFLDNRVGIEDVQLAAYEVVQEGINAAIALEETEGHSRDALLATFDDYLREVGTVDVERFEARNIHYGHRPSMIEAPIEDYPSLAVMCAIAGPNPTTADYGHSFALRLAIEFIVRSGPYREDVPDTDKIGEDIVGRRLDRTIEAVFKLIDANSSLGGKFLPPDFPPSINKGDIFVRQEDGPSGTGRRWYWQGARMEWVFAKQTVNIDQF